jgi:hypothetical protein
MENRLNPSFDCAHRRLLGGMISDQRRAAGYIASCRRIERKRLRAIGLLRLHFRQSCGRHVE